MKRSMSLVAVAASACAGPAVRTDPFAGRIAGTPVQCVALSSGSSPAAVDASTIVVRESGGRLWRTGPRGSCPALGRTPVTLIVEVFGGQLCRNDRFRVLEVGATIPSAPCLFDRFTPYDRPRARSD
jgi:hypothetical protein